MFESEFDYGVILVACTIVIPVVLVLWPCVVRLLLLCCSNNSQT